DYSCQVYDSSAYYIF
nr:immunoglobulin light chain junction region [Macaca mulatta]MOY06431.1 immunoglobulin light chain junction region [Macaca mulatta]MOY07989.1 immunoglobulin light chain junction region [Macaca mulatta]MOY08345.1 immunoglobulin light chain junction region [Macaca mulatta]MOY08865.1 immunoglobulin light chain junction region [Macaca mulatta]